MKREVSFFKDRRASGSDALLKTFRALGMTDKEIKAALKKYQAEQKQAADLTPADTDDMNQRTEETQRQDDYDSASEGHP